MARKGRVQFAGAVVEQEVVLGELGVPHQKRRLQYRRFVERGLLEPVLNPLAEAKWQAVLGSEKFQQMVRDRLRGWKERGGGRLWRCGRADRRSDRKILCEK